MVFSTRHRNYYETPPGSTEEEEVKDDEEGREEDVEDDGTDLLSTQDNTHGQYIGKE